MSMPFFSIIIPTKNRPEQLREAILSVLLQDFCDFELIISDNFNDKRTKEVVDEYVSDPRVKYFRTDEELNMPDHWEFAGRKARGEYILFLSDRSLFLRGTLKKVSDVIKTYSSQNIQAYTWKHVFFESEIKTLRPVANLSSGITVFSSRELEKGYARNHRVDWYYPMILNGCFNNKLATTIRDTYGKMFFPIAPDGFGGFLLLAHTEKIVGISEALFLGQSVWNSNGNNCIKTGPEAYLQTLNLTDWHRHVPIKATFIHNINFDDFLTVKKMVGGQPFNINWVNYFLRCYEEYVYSGISGFIKTRKSEFFGAWMRALAEFDQDTQSRVRKKMMRVRVLYTIKAVLAMSPLLALLRGLQSRLIYGYSSRYYANALEAAGFTVQDTSTIKKRIV